MPLKTAVVDIYHSRLKEDKDEKIMKPRINQS